MCEGTIPLQPYQYIECREYSCCSFSSFSSFVSISPPPLPAGGDTHCQPFSQPPTSWATCHLLTTNYHLQTATYQLPPANCHLPTATCQLTDLFSLFFFLLHNFFSTEFLFCQKKKVLPICFLLLHWIFARKHLSGPKGPHCCSWRLQPSAGARKSRPKGGNFSSKYQGRSW